MMRSTIDILKLYAKAHPLALSAIIIASLFWAVTWPASPYLLGILVDALQNTNQAVFSNQSTGFMSWLTTSVNIIGWPVAAMIIINLLRNMVYYTIGVSFEKSIPSSKAALISKLFRYLLGQSYGYFENQYSGQLANKIANAQSGLESAIQLLNLNIATLLALVISGGLLASVNPFFALIFWLWAISICCYSYRNALIGERKSKAYATSQSQLQGEMVDSLSNMMTVVTDATGGHEIDRLDKFVNQYVEEDRSLQSYFNLARLGHGLLTTLFISLMLIGLLVGFYYQTVSAGDFAFILSLSWSMAGFVHDLGKQFLDLSQHLGKLSEGMSLLQVVQNVKDKENAKDYALQKGSIKFSNVSFGYNDKLVLEDLNLEIHSGEKVGIVGRSGCGKTTLLKLILRLYDVKKGLITIDDHPIQSMTQIALRHQISLVPQDISLFHRSIAENVAYGVAHVSNEDLIEAAKKAHIHDFIMSLPEEYNTLVGQRGLKISGGQRQRIAIARAFLRNPPIVLLDEATSALDSKTEAIIQQSLGSLMKGRTTIVVAHRLSTLIAMDRIIVLDQGRIVEQGDHKTLLLAKGLYSQLWEKQHDGFIDLLV
ncbi:MAG: ABC transporter ATP-binding protein [Proteobacteria bacterium]|nr:ABC transporter ATP-binding protein [Pseudomonadota bacterium]